MIHVCRQGRNPWHTSLNDATIVIMLAYVGYVDIYGLHHFITEDAVPSDLLQQLVQEWSSHATTVVRAMISEDDAEEIRQKIVAECHLTAYTILLNRAIELTPILQLHLRRGVFASNQYVPTIETYLGACKFDRFAFRPPTL